MFTGMSFVVKSTPSIFQRMILGVVGTIQGTLLCLYDFDIAVADHTTLRNHVRQVHYILERSPITVNEGKSENWRNGWIS